MPCDRTLSFIGQTTQQRIKEIGEVVEKIEQQFAKGKVKAIIGKQGAPAFTGIEEVDRRKVSDACIYRRMMSKGNALTRMLLAEAEAKSGNRVNTQALGRGVHAHEGPDGNLIWHDHK